MSEYRLQTEISDETRRVMNLYDEKYALLAEVQAQEKKIAKSLTTSTKVLSLLIVINVLLSFIWQEPADFFVVIVYGVGFAVEIIWLMLGLRKRRRKIEDWRSVVEETEMQNYGN